MLMMLYDLMINWMIELSVVVLWRLKISFSSGKYDGDFDTSKMVI